MQHAHRIVIRGRSMIIDEMYFRIEEMCSVDIVRQERPLLLRMMLLGAGLCVAAAIACIWIYSSVDKAALLYAAGALSAAAVIELIVFFSIKRRYALRIGQSTGMTKAIVSYDRDELEKIRLQITEALKIR